MPTSYLRRGSAVRSGQVGRVDAAPVYINTTTSKLKFIPASSGTTEVSVGDSATGLVANAAAATLGFGTGAGGAVTQITSRATGVTVNTICGTITTINTSLAAEASAVFVVTNSTVAIGDVVLLSMQSGAVALNTDVVVSAVAAGSFSITVINNNVAAGVAETGAILINFIVIKAVSA